MISDPQSTKNFQLNRVVLQKSKIRPFNYKLSSASSKIINQRPFSYLKTETSVFFLYMQLDKIYNMRLMT